MFSLGVPEITLIAVIGLVVFGPGKLPEVGNPLVEALENCAMQSMNKSRIKSCRIYNNSYYGNNSKAATEK
jgi:sec-independent protein translocase protein TatA